MAAGAALALGAEAGADAGSAAAGAGATGAGGGATLAGAGGTGSVLGEQAASNAMPAKGVISIKRRRVVDGVMANSLLRMDSKVAGGLSDDADRTAATGLCDCVHWLVELIV
jgi:hypothetical protein